MRKKEAAFLAVLLLVSIVVGCGPSKEDKAFAKIEPALLAPEDGETFDHYPRNLVLTWHKVEGAVRYQIEVQMQNPLDGQWMPTPVVLNRRFVEHERIQITFPGSQPGRWRVMAINGNGTNSRASDWRRFDFVSGL